MNTTLVQFRDAQLELLAAFDDAAELPRPTRPYRAPNSASGRLALGQTHYGHHYFLDGQAIYDGSLLEVRVAGAWRRGLFTWSADLRDAPRLAVLASIDTRCELIDLEPDPLCRWALPGNCVS